MSGNRGKVVPFMNYVGGVLHSGEDIYCVFFQAAVFYPHTFNRMDFSSSSSMDISSSSWVEPTLIIISPSSMTLELTPDREGK